MAIREAESMVGSPRIGPTAVETSGRRDFHLSCVASRDITKGECIEASDISFHRPGDGISPALEDVLIGLKVRRTVKKGHKFKMDDFHG